MTTTGGCACGAIRYEIASPPVFQFACHCRACQHSTGGSPTLWIIVPAAAFNVTKGEPRTYGSAGESGGQVHRAFCGACGSPLFSRLESSPEIVAVKVGGLDDPAAFQVQADLWMSTAQPWHKAHEGAARFETNPG